MFYSIDQSLKPIINKKRKHNSTLIVPLAWYCKNKNKASKKFYLSLQLKLNNKLYFTNLQYYKNLLEKDMTN